MNDAIRIGGEVQTWFRHATVMELFHEGVVVDGRRGGLVVGRSHAAGNIYMLQQVEPDRYIIPANIEGGEYLVTHVAFTKYEKRFHEINSWQEETPSISSIPVSGSTRVINTSAEPSDKFILMDYRGQFVVNKYATNRFFHEIEKLNCEAGDFTDYKLTFKLIE